MILVTIDDFNNFYSLAQSNQTIPVLQSYIDKYEEVFIKKILGVELGQLFIDDITGMDSDSGDIEDRFIVLRDAFIKQSSFNCEQIFESIGMKNLLAGLIFCEYVSDTQMVHAQNGVSGSDSETSKATIPENAARFGEQKWNDSLGSIRAIQWWCGWEDKENYPEFKGVRFKPRYSPLM